MLAELINNPDVRTLAWFVAVLLVMAVIALGLWKLLEMLDAREEERLEEGKDAGYTILGLPVVEKDLLPNDMLKKRFEELSFGVFIAREGPKTPRPTEPPKGMGK